MGAATKLQCTFRGRRSRKTTQQQRKLVEAVAESNVIEATVAEEAPETQATQEGGVETQQSPPVDDAVNEASAAEKPPAIIESSADDLDAPVDDDVPLVPPLKPAAIIESTADDLGAPMTDDDFPRADPEDERAAATKLQSTYRGSKGRKEMKNR